MAKLKKLSNQNKILVFAGLIAVGLFVGLWLLPYLGLYSLTPATPDTPADSFVIVAHDSQAPSNTEELEEDLTFAWYGVDVEDMDDDEIEDLAWADFALADADEDDFEPEENYIYLLKATGTDICTQYWTTDARVFEGDLPLLELGVNDIYFYNETEDVSMLAFNHVGGTTVLNTDYDEWTIDTFCLDASEGVDADVTHLEGYKYYYNPETAMWMSPVIKIKFNATATVAFAELKSPIVNREVCATVYLYIEMNTNLSFENDFSIDIGSGLGTTFELVDITIGWGSASSFSALDTQA